MALPKLDTPTFDYTLPVSQIPVTFRPFLVKEEKLLLVGKEASVGQQVSAMKQVLNNVILSPHIAGVTVESTIRMATETVQNVIDVLDDKINQSVVVNNKEIGM